MQRILMGKGAAKKIRGPEKVEEARMNEDEEDELFARTKGKRKVSTLRTSQSSVLYEVCLTDAWDASSCDEYGRVQA